MYLGCVRDSAVLPLFAAGECPCCRGAAGGGAARPGLRRRPNCHLLEIIEICVLKFVLHCTCMKCSSVFRTTVVKVIVDNAPPTRGRGCRRRGDGARRLAAACRRGGARAAGRVAGPRAGASGVAEQPRARTASRHGAPRDSPPLPGLASWGWRQRRPCAARRARRRPLLSLVVSLCHSLYIVVTMS